jgi:hypothetical protein
LPKNDKMVNNKHHQTDANCSATINLVQGLAANEVELSLNAPVIPPRPTEPETNLEAIQPNLIDASNEANQNMCSPIEMDETAQ